MKENSKRVPSPRHTDKQIAFNKSKAVKEDKMQNEHPLRTSLRLMIHSDSDLIEYVGHLNDAFDIIYVL